MALAQDHQISSRPAGRWPPTRRSQSSSPPDPPSPWETSYDGPVPCTTPSGHLVSSISIRSWCTFAKHPLGYRGCSAGRGSAWVCSPSEATPKQCQLPGRGCDQWTWMYLLSAHCFIWCCCSFMAASGWPEQRLLLWQGRMPRALFTLLTLLALLTLWQQHVAGQAPDAGESMLFSWARFHWLKINILKQESETWSATPARPSPYRHAGLSAFCLHQSGQWK